MNKWQRVGEPKLVHNGWRKVFLKTFTTPDGKTMEAEIADEEGRQAAAIIALTAGNKVVIARQFRCGPELVFDELPGGAVEPGEDPKVAATRELLEETGYRAGTVEYLGEVYKHAWMNSKWHYYLATNCEPDPDGQQLEDFEFVEVELISVARLFENARNAKMTDTEAILLAYEKLKAIEEAA